MTKHISTRHNSPPVDPALLRRALRLVHCLQKERGASCAYYASHQQPSVVIVENMERARKDCDRAIQMMIKNSKSSESKVQSTLLKIRNMVTAHPGEHTQNSRHKILVCFNALISSVVHDYFMEKIALQQKNLFRKKQGQSNGNDNGDNKSSNGNSSNQHQEANGGFNYKMRSISMGNCAAYGFQNGYNDGTTATTATANNHYIGINMSSAPSKESYMPDNNREIPWSSPPDTLDAIGSAAPPLIPPDHVPIQVHGNSKPLSSSFGALGGGGGGGGGHRNYGTGSMHHHHSSPRQQTTRFLLSNTTEDDPESQVARLLNLLACFVKLKESTGVERAVLSSLVVSGKEDSLLLSDLVMEVENQRRLLEELKRLPVGSLRSLVEELVEMSKPLRDLQQRILKNFNLEGVSEGILSNKAVIWELMTVYINKLHALELLIIEEIEYCLPEITIDNEQISENQLLSGTNFITGMFGSKVSGEEAKAKLEQMPAEEIKQRLLSGFVTSKNDESSDTDTNGSNHDNSIATVNGEIEDPLRLIPNLPASKEWEINLYELKFLKRIGKGAAGTTYLANWTGLKVAVKVASITETGLEGWRTEVQALQKLHHPNVIRLLGSVYHPNPLTFCLVLEHCSAGDLAQAMKFPTAPGFFFKVATGISHGMAYLHSRGIMHRDIKPDNILCDGNVKSGNFTVKVSDFGVATESSVLGDRTAETGTYRWMSPEVLRHESYSNMADVYSYAIVLWQLCTREDPYANISQIEAAGKVALEKARPPFPSGAPESIRSLIRICWAEHPEERLPFDKVVEKLGGIPQTMTVEEHKWLDAPLGHPVYYPREETNRDHQQDNGERNNHKPLLSSQAKNHKREPLGEKDKKSKSGLFKIFGR